MNRGVLFKCPYCGSILQVVHPGQVPVCCGKPMLLVQPNTVDAAHEKHIPVVTADAEGYTHVQIGAVLHPMTAEHYIEWVEIDAGDRDGKHFFQPGDTPEFTFHVPFRAGLAVTAYCNKHGLWKTVTE